MNFWYRLGDRLSTGLSRRVGVGLICLMVITACKNNPYPEGVTFEPVDGSDEEVVRQEPTLFLRAQNLMQFVEGEEAVYEIKGFSQSGATQIELFGLPRGAEFDSEMGELKWTPDFFAANNPQDTEVFHRTYPLHVRIFDEVNRRIFLEREVTLLVFDSARDMLIWTDAEAELSEGQFFSQDVEVLDEDYPGSEINLYSPDLPKGATLERIASDSAASFRITFTAPADFAKYGGSSDADGYYRDINFRIQAIGPRQHVSTKVIQWRIRDMEQKIRVATPSEVRGDDRVNFTVHLADENFETVPQMEIVHQPEQGSFVLQRIQENQTRKTSVYEVVWSEILPSMQGKQETLHFRACSHEDRPNACQEFNVQVLLDGVVHPSPKFTRSSWPLGVLKTAVVGEVIEEKIQIQDPEVRSPVKDLDIEVSNPALTVAWDRSTSRLQVGSTAVGVFQFNLRARTAYGVEGLESMMVEFLAPTPTEPSSSDLPAILERLGE